MLNQKLSTDQISVASNNEISDKLYKFLTDSVKTQDDLKKLRQLDGEILTIYLRHLRNYLELSESEMWNFHGAIKYAVCAFTDACFRIQNTNVLTNKKKSHPQFQYKIDKWLEGPFSELSITDSINLRTQLIQLVLMSQGYCLDLNLPIPEKKELHINDLNLPFSKTEKKLLLKNIIPFFLKNIECLFFVTINTFRSLIKLNRNPKIGYTNLDIKYFKQIPDLIFAPIRIQVTEPNLYSITQARKVFYEINHKTFSDDIFNLELNQLFPDFQNSITFSNLLLAFLIAHTDKILFDKNRLQEAIATTRNYLSNLKLSAIIGQGKWNTIENSILSISAQRNRLPVIEYQLGGNREIQYEGQGYGNERPSAITDCLSWGEWREDFPHFYKIIDPYLQYLEHSGKIHRPKLISRKKGFNVLYTPPAVSLLFTVAHINSYDTDNIIPHRQLMDQALLTFDEIAECKIFVKIKGFGYKIFEGAEKNFLHSPALQKAKIEFFRKGIASKYFNYVDLHFTDSMSTTLIESMAFNLPTIVFWNSNILEVRPLYQNLFSRMVNSGIIVKNLSEARLSINNIYNNPQWWYQDKIQNIREEFLFYFANCKGDWKTSIKLAIDQIMAQSKNKDS